MCLVRHRGLHWPRVGLSDHAEIGRGNYAASPQKQHTEEKKWVRLKIYTHN